MLNIGADNRSTLIHIPAFIAEIKTLLYTGLNSGTSELLLFGLLKQQIQAELVAFQSHKSRTVTYTIKDFKYTSLRVQTKHCLVMGAKLVVF